MADPAYTETGILEHMWQQGGDRVSYVTGGEKEYVMTWKGPWAQIKNVYSSTPVVCGTSINVGMTFAPGQLWISEHPMDNTINWRIKSFSVQEDTAGDHGTLVLTLTPRRSGETYYDSLSSWTLSWGQFTASPLAFCSNNGLSANAQAQNIIHAVNYYKAHNLSGQLSAWEENGETYYLNQVELSVAKIYANDIYAQYAYPIVTLRQSWTGLSSLEDASVPDWGSKMNVISSNFTLPDTITFDPGHPSFLPRETAQDKWAWILRDFTVQQTHGDSIWVDGQEIPQWNIDMTARWEGCRDTKLSSNIQDAFYSADDRQRWRFGSL